ncbi:MAG: peptidoglycan-binding protein, partial [Cyanobacteria bacterium REEB65]|nr:peptidoglycan-binding protein [Cyanobacteria bacterium REEB65]
GVWNGLVNAVKRLFVWLGNLAGGSGTNSPVAVPTPAPSSPPPDGLSPQQQAIAQEYSLLATPANVNAFLAEVQAYPTEGVLGPGSTDTATITDLQKGLAQLGYSVQATGIYDQATQQAVMAFKEASGLHQSYQAANGNWAVNEYLDPQTLALLNQKLQAAASPTTPAPVAIPTPAPVSPPVSAPTPPPATVPTPTPASAPTPAPVSGPTPTNNDALIAQQYGLLDTPGNISAFLAEVQQYQSNGALGPGVNNPSAVSDLQKALAILGYTVADTGTFDTATGQAVMAFKQANGIHQTYQSADGTYAINEYVDASTLAAIMAKLPAASSTVTPSTTPNTATSAAPPSPTASPSTGNTPTAPAASTSPSVDYATIAQQYGLLDSPDNVNAFMTEVKGYQAANALGPGSTQTSAITDLQTALSKIGYSVPATGSFDSATSQAVIAFKQANGIHQTYQAANGSWAVNEWVDAPT